MVRGTSLEHKRGEALPWTKSGYGAMSVVRDRLARWGDDGGDADRHQQGQAADQDFES